MSATLDIFDPGAWLTAASVVGIVIAAYVAIMWIALIVWVYRDIEQRTHDRMTQAMSVGLVALFFVPGILLYLAFRPRETLVDAYNRQLEAEAFLQEIQKHGGACPSCRRAVRDDYRTCPYCQTELRVACAGCGVALHTHWVACPYCSRERNVPAPAVAASAPPPLSESARPERRPERARPATVMPRFR